MVIQKAIGSSRKIDPRSISRPTNPRSTLQSMGALFVLLTIVMSLVLGVALVAQHAYADIVPPRPRPNPPPPSPPPPEGFKMIPGDLRQEISDGAAAGGGISVALVEKYAGN